MFEKKLLLVLIGLMVFLIGFGTFVSVFSAVDLPSPFNKVRYQISKSVPEDIAAKLKTTSPRGGLSDSDSEESIWWASYHDNQNNKYYFLLRNNGTRAYWVRWELVYKITRRSLLLASGETKYITISSNEKAKLMWGKVRLFYREKSLFGLQFLGGNNGSTAGEAYPPISLANSKW